MATGLTVSKPIPAAPFAFDSGRIGEQICRFNDVGFHDCALLVFASFPCNIVRRRSFPIGLLFSPLPTKSEPMQDEPGRDWVVDARWTQNCAGPCFVVAARLAGFAGFGQLPWRSGTLFFCLGWPGFRARRRALACCVGGLGIGTGFHFARASGMLVHRSARVSG